MLHQQKEMSLQHLGISLIAVICGTAETKVSGENFQSDCVLSH